MSLLTPALASTHGLIGKMLRSYRVDYTAEEVEVAAPQVQIPESLQAVLSLMSHNLKEALGNPQIQFDESDQERLSSLVEETREMAIRSDWVNLPIDSMTKKALDHFNRVMQDALTRAKVDKASPKPEIHQDVSLTSKEVEGAVLEIQRRMEAHARRINGGSLTMRFDQAIKKEFKDLLKKTKVNSYTVPSLDLELRTAIEEMSAKLKAAGMGRFTDGLEEAVFGV